MFMVPGFTWADDDDDDDHRCGRFYWYLQKQINDLQQQCNGPKAYTNNSFIDALPQQESIDFISLSLPAGHFFMTMDVQATFWQCGVYNEHYHTYLGCNCIDEAGVEIPACGVGGGVVGRTSLGDNLALTLEAPTTITLRCSHNCLYDDDSNDPDQCNDPLAMSIVWTAFEVDEIENQFSP
jgi:hypothetical protein